MCVAIQRTATSKEPNACVGFWSVIFSSTNVSEVCISLIIVSVFALFFCYWVFLKNWSSQRHSLPILIPTVCVCVNHATMYASQHIWCLFQARIKWEGCGRKGIWRKNGGMMVGCWLVRLQWRPPGGCCVCLCYLLLHIKVQKISSFLQAPVHPGCPEKKGRKTVVCVTLVTMPLWHLLNGFWKGCFG